MSFGSRINTVIKRKSLSLKDLSRRTEIPVSQLQELLENKLNPTFIQINRICEAIGQDPIIFSIQSINDLKTQKTLISIDQKLRGGVNTKTKIKKRRRTLRDFVVIS